MYEEVKNLNIQKNSRQMPKEGTIVSDKNYCDLVYAWLQCISDRQDSGAAREIPSNKVNFCSMSKQLGMDRRTVAKYVKALETMGLLTKNELKKTYTLQILEPKSAALIPFLTLRELTNSLSKNCINTFIYLLNRYLANCEQTFIVTHKQIKTYLGIATAASSNNCVVNDLLKTLSRLGLIKYELRQLSYNDSEIFITKVFNVLPE